MADERKPHCPRCRLKWKTVVMEETRGSWTLQRVLICPECDLWDYPDETGPRCFGPVVWH